MPTGIISSSQGVQDVTGVKYKISLHSMLGVVMELALLALVATWVVKITTSGATIGARVGMLQLVFFQRSSTC